MGEQQQHHLLTTSFFTVPLTMYTIASLSHKRHAIKLNHNFYYCNTIPSVGSPAGFCLTYRLSRFFGMLLSSHLYHLSYRTIAFTLASGVYTTKQNSKPSVKLSKLLCVCVCMLTASDNGRCEERILMSMRIKGLRFTFRNFYSLHNNNNAPLCVSHSLVRPIHGPTFVECWSAGLLGGF